MLFKWDKDNKSITCLPSCCGDCGLPTLGPSVTWPVFPGLKRCRLCGSRSLLVIPHVSRSTPALWGPRTGLRLQLGWSRSRMNSASSSGRIFKRDPLPMLFRTTPPVVPCQVSNSVIYTLMKHAAYLRFAWSLNLHLLSLAASHVENLPPRVLLTITKLQCMLDSKQERIIALERQVEDLMQDRKFLRSQIDNLTSTRSMATFASPSAVTEGRCS